MREGVVGVIVVDIAAVALLVVFVADVDVAVVSVAVGADDVVVAVVVGVDVPDCRWLPALSFDHCQGLSLDHGVLE